MGVGRIAQRRAGHFALGHFREQVDAAADTAATRRRAVQERARAIDDLYRGKELGRHQLARGDAIEAVEADIVRRQVEAARSEEHTPELQSLMRISYAVFCLKKKKKTQRAKQAPTRQNQKAIT